MLEDYSEKYKIDITKISIQFKVQDKSAEDIKSGPEDGVFVHGL